MDGVIGYVTMFAGNFAPKNWAMCDGSLLPIRNFTALFSIIGVAFGGDGKVTFALPDLRGRAVVGAGQGTGLQNFYDVGQQGGAESNTLQTANMPQHTHNIPVTITPAAATSATTPSPANAVFANSTEVLYGTTGDVTMQVYQGSITTGAIGNSSPFSQLQPALGLNYIICMNGIFPSRG